MSNLLICVDRKDFPATLPHIFYLPEKAPVVLCGPTESLTLPRSVILNSRQTPRLNRNQNWICRTLEALRRYDPRETVLISSLGTPAWDFLTWAGGRLGFPLIIVFPAGSAQSFNVIRTKTLLDFNLDEHRVLALRPIRIGRKRPSIEDNLMRDRWILALSHQFAPVSVRPGGNLDGMLSHQALPASSIQTEYRIESEPPLPLKKPLALGGLQIPDWYAAEKYLIHWTRSCIGPYPEETRHDYFSRVMESESEALEGCDTLERILQEGVIRASSRMVRGGYPVVPFTERPPQDLLRLIQWRSGLRRWTFEPYGIALSRSKLAELGARPVIYDEAARFHELAESDRPFFQVNKSAGFDWTTEREWRVQGDLNLNGFERDDLIVMVRDNDEAEALRDRFTWRVFSLSDSGRGLTPLPE